MFEGNAWMHAAISLSSFLPGPAKKRLDDAAKLSFKRSHDAALLALEKDKPVKPDAKKGTEAEVRRPKEIVGLRVVGVRG